MALTYTLAAIVLLGLCILVHEFGHLIGGRMVGIKAEVFSLGYGRGVLKKKIGETTYQVTLIPFGGYVKFFGENPGEDREGEGHEFLSAHPLKRIVAVIMGPLFNLFFGVLIFLMMNLVGYEKETNKIYIPEYWQSGPSQSAAFKAGIESGDIITKVGDRKVDDFQGLQAALFFNGDQPADITVSRDGEAKTFHVEPENRGGQFFIGVMPYGDSVILAGVGEDGAAAKAGLKKMDVIKKVDGIALTTVQQFVDYVHAHGGQEIQLSLERGDETLTMPVTPSQSRVLKIRMQQDGEFRQLLLLDDLTENIRQARVLIDKTVITSMDEFLETIEDGQSHSLIVKGEKIEGWFSVAEQGMLGIYPAISPEMKLVQYEFGEAMKMSVVEPYEFIAMNLMGMGRLFSGKMDVKENLSGPIRIAKIAGDVAYYQGLSAFIILMAKISIILMVMNLLPIPVVDGGQLVFFLIEAIRGKPLPEAVMIRIQTVGLFLLLALGAFVIFNDLASLNLF